MTCPTYYTNPVDYPPSLPTDVQNCLGITSTTLDDWEAYLNPVSQSSPQCENILQQYINENNTFNLSNYQQIQSGMNYSFSLLYGNRYNGKITFPGQNGYSVVQDYLINLCSKPDLPGICNIAQQNLCTSCSRTQILSPPTLTELCGCFVPVDPISSANNVPPECDPLCSQGKVIKKATSAGAEIKCQESVCVITNVSINASASVFGNITFNQVCPACATQSETGCVCIIDASIPDIGKSLNLNNPEVFNQSCGKNSVCLRIDTQGNSTSVPCTDLNTLAPTTYYFSVSIWVYIIAFVILFMGIFSVLSILHDRKYLQSTISR